MTPGTVEIIPTPPLDDVARLVVVAPHPDDEVLACGLLLAHAAELGLDVRVIAVTDGEAAYPDRDPFALAAVRRQEQRSAIEAVGLSPDVVHRLALPDGAVHDHVANVADAIRAHRGDRNQRTMLVAPSIHDWHPDHEACGRAARSVAAEWRGPFWSSLFWAHQHPAPLLASTTSLLRIDGDPVHHDARARAVGCHRSQFSRDRGEPVLTERDIRHLAAPCEFYVGEHP